MTNVDKRVRAKFGGYVTIQSYGLGSAVYLEVQDTITDRRVLHEFGPSNARQFAAALFAAANDAEGKPISPELEKSVQS